MTEWGGEFKDLHLAYTLINISAGWETWYLFGGQLEYADLASLDCDLLSDAADLSLRVYGLGFDLLD